VGGGPTRFHIHTPGLGGGRGVARVPRAAAVQGVGLPLTLPRGGRPEAYFAAAARDGGRPRANAPACGRPRNAADRMAATA